MPFPTNRIRLRVKHKNLLYNRSKTRLSPFVSLDQSSEHHQKILINEFQAILHQTR